MAKVKMYHAQRVNGTVANLDGVKRAVGNEADAIGRKANSRLAGHRAQGFAKIEVNKGIAGKYGHVDAEVDLVDNGKHIAAAAIEFGHVQKYFGDKVIGYTPGLYIVTGAAGLA